MVIENVFVTSDALSAALDPSGRAPTTAVRRLREAGLISRGIELRLHRARRLRGASVYYCALNIDAAESVSDGDKDAARRLAEASGAIETSGNVREIVHGLLGARGRLEEGDLRRLPVGEQREVVRLADLIARERNRLVHREAPLLGLVIAMDDRRATIETESELVVLPRETLGVRGLDRLGAAVAIRSRRLQTGVMIHSAEEALTAEADDRHGAREFDPFTMRREQSGRDIGATLERALAGTEPVRLLAPLPVAR